MTPSPEAPQEHAGGRGSSMRRRIANTATATGVSPIQIPIVLAAVDAAIAPRESGACALPSDHHPAFLHPGRTVLILLDDLGEVDGCVLAVAALAESRDVSLRVPPATARQLLFAAAPAGTTDAIASDLTPPEHAMEWWSGLPEPDWRGSGSPGDEELLEQFVTAPDVVLRVGLAEALDHLRHAHLWEARRERVRARELAERVFGPLAPRAHPVLERRFQWWMRRVGQGGGRFE